MTLPGGHGVEGIAKVKGLRSGPTLGRGRCEREMHLRGGMAQSVQIDMGGTGHDQRMIARHAAEQVKAGFMMLDELDAIARTAAAAQFTRGRERGMGEHEHAGRHRGSPFAGDDVSGIVRDASGVDAGNGEEGAKHGWRSWMGAMRDQAAARAVDGMPEGACVVARDAGVGLTGA